jgi:phosphoribosylanthranilate isomerase
MDKKGRVRVKICGITNEKDAIMTCKLGADAIGFVFAESKRKVTPEIAKEIIKNLPPFISTVGIFVDEELNEINRITDFALLDAVQLHGRESDEYCHEVNRKVIKGIKVTEDDSKKSLIKKMETYSVSAFILDPGKGSGKTFNWEIAQEIEKPIIIAGGLTPFNVSEVIRKLNPYGVDVSTGVEKDYGIKDKEKVEKFIREAHSC